jgi:segregation and condensation protein B
MNESFLRNVIEAALLAAGKSLQPTELAQLFEDSARPGIEEIRAALAGLAEEYASRGIEIKEPAAGFRIQVRRELANEISRLWPERPAKYSRALLETLALIAYRQPITRGEIEAVRGVAVNPNIIKTVLERNWVRVVGHRDVPGRPELLGTTREFLDYFGLRNLDELPPLAQLKTLGEMNLQLELPGAPLAAHGAGADRAEGADAAAATGAADAAEGAASAGGAASGEGADAAGGAYAAGGAASAEGADAAGDAGVAALLDTEASSESGTSDADEVSEDDELSADSNGSRELVAAPRSCDD